MVNLNENGLKNLSKEVASGNDNISAKLLNDIELTNKADNISWVPIGGTRYQYKGTFDGDDKTISGLYINDNTSDYKGLFGVSFGTVKNLTLKDVEITAKEYASAIIGFNLGDITNVHVDNVTINASTYVGAIVGANDGNIYVSSASFINLTATYIFSYIGGIVGEGNGNIGATYVDNATITANSADARLGGIIGSYNGGEIVSSYTNDVTITNTGGSIYVGGIVGYNNGGSLSSNYFVSNTNSLFGVGSNGTNSSNDNATRVTSVQALNDNVTKMNSAIDIWVRDGVDREFGFRYDELTAPDNATRIPALIPYQPQP